MSPFFLVLFDYRLQHLQSLRKRLQIGLCVDAGLVHVVQELLRYACQETFMGHPRRLTLILAI
jgi:hypothetical protein